MTVISTHCPGYSNIHLPRHLNHQDKLTEIAGY
jgi:hypothetical protein